MLVPFPFEAKLSLPGLRRACSMSPRTSLTGVFAGTTSTFAPLPTSATGARSFFVSKGSDLYSDTLIALGGAAIRSVWPSGALFATKSVPILPPEPVRFSTKTGCPSASLSRGASARAVKSVIPPGGKVTTSRIGFAGYCPSAAAEKTSAASAMARIARRASGRLLRCGPRLLQPRQDLLRDERDLVDRFLVREMAGVAGHEEVAQAADAVDEFLQLAGHVVGRANKHDARFDEVLDRAVLRVDELAVAGHRAALASRLDHARRVLHREISGRRAKGLGDDPRGAQIARHDLGAPPGFRPVLGDRHEPEVGEPVGRRHRAAEFGAGLAVVIEQVFRLETGKEGAEHVAALGDLADILRAPAGDPYRRMRLLVDARPDVDVAVLEVLALPVEWAVDRGHRLDDQIVRLPEAVHLADSRAHRQRHLVGHAAHQAHLQPSARDHVDHRQLPGHPHRVETVRDRVAEREQARALRLPREDRERHRGHGAAAGGGRVVLVDHDVEAQFVREQPFVEAVVVVLGHDFRIAVAGGKNHAQRLVLRHPRVRIRLLGKMVHPHDVSFSRASGAWRSSPNSITRRATASGCSMCGKWPDSAISSNFAPGTAAQ